MGSDNYNIDDILSEVKKRREENEKEIKARDEAPKDKPIVETVAEPTAAPAPLTESDEEIVFENLSAEATEENRNSTVSEPTSAKAVEEAMTAPETKIENAVSVREDKPDEGMVNLLDIAGGDEENNGPLPIAEQTAKRRAPKEKKKMNKTLKAVIIILIVLIFAAIGVAVAVANNWINTVTGGDETLATTESVWQGMKTLEESFEAINETEADEISSMEDMIKTWYYNGTPCYSTHVLNVLLVGEDTREDEISEEGTRADSAIIVSVNIDTKEVTLTSILRDSWAYWEIEEGNEETGTFGKLNEAMSTGGLNAYINAVEHLYKIRLDGYAIVNFDSFEKIIDSLPQKSVTLELTSKEIEEINSNPDRYGDVYIEKTFEGSSGELQLTGEQALAYCRIRYIDSDNARADRQKTTLIEIYKEVKDLGTARLLGIIDAVVPYVKTSFGKSDIVKIAKYAFSQGWLDYDIRMQNFPESNVKGGKFKPDYNSQWIWKADFPADAYMLQTRVYGKSSITLAHIRVNTQEVRQKGFFKKGDNPTTATVVNKNYGEVTTFEPLEILNSDEEEDTTETTE